MTLYILYIEEVESTDNLVERVLSYGSLWKKESKGTQSQKGKRWVVRTQSFKKTCSIRSLDSFPLVVELWHFRARDVKILIYFEINNIYQHENENIKVKEFIKYS